MSLAEWLRSQDKDKTSPLKAPAASPPKATKSAAIAVQSRLASATGKLATPALFAPSTSTSKRSSSSVPSPDVIDISDDAITVSPSKRGKRLSTADFSNTVASVNGSVSSSSIASSSTTTPSRQSRASGVKSEYHYDDGEEEQRRSGREVDDEWTEDSSSSRSRSMKKSNSAAKEEEMDADEDRPLSARYTRKTPSKRTSASSSSSASTASRGTKRKAPSTSSASPSTAVSSDASVVLRHVRSAIADMQLSENQPIATLASLGLSGVKREVALMDEDEVRCQIEKVFLLVTDSILASEGFAFDVPVRSGANQLFVPELNRIVLRDRVNRREFASYKHSRKAAITARVLGLVYELCQKRIHTTKRDLFYTDVKLFTKQEESDDVLDDAAAMIGCTRTSLNVVASEKGVVVGQISFFDSGDFIDCTKMGVGGKAIPPLIDRVTGITGSAQFVLLVEKDAAFMRLAEDRFYNTYPCCIITAKGQPDVATRLFLKKVKDTLRIPILGLVDSDPYGLKILSVYVSGSKNMSYDSASLTTADIHWLGVRPSDLDRYNIPQQCRLPMTEHDVATGKQMLQEDFIQKNPRWLKELETMVERREKAEIQALSSFGFQYLSKVFLPRKIQEGDRAASSKPHSQSAYCAGPSLVQLTQRVVSVVCCVVDVGDWI